MERCPVCRARLAGTPVCRRCGCDLTLALALRALMQGSPEQALAEVERARGLDPSALVRCIGAFVSWYRDYLLSEVRGESRISRCEGW